MIQSAPEIDMSPVECKHCKETKKCSEFYDYRAYGGTMKKTCRQCQSRDNHKYYARRKNKIAKDSIAHLESVSKAQRATALFSMVKSGELAKRHFQEVIRQVEF